MSDSRRTPEALLSAARRAKPDEATRRRIRAGIDGRLALIATAGVGVGTAAGASAVAAEGAAVGGAVVVAKASLFGVVAKVGLAVGLLVATGAGVRAFVISARAPEAALSPSAALDESAPAADAVAAATAPIEASAVDSGPPATASAAEEIPALPAPPSARGSARRDAASIAAEVALLRKAQASLREGDGAASLKAIDALAAKHPDGALREERDAARVLALCAAGRVDDARVEALRFLGRWPSSVQAPRVRASCAFASKPAASKP